MNAGLLQSFGTRVASGSTAAPSVSPPWMTSQVPIVPMFVDTQGWRIGVSAAPPKSFKVGLVTTSNQ